MADADVGVQLFVSATQLVRAVETHIQQRYGLSTGRFAVLLTLSSAPGGQRTPSSVAELLAVRRPTITGIVNGLESSGFVQRCSDRADGRNQPVRLTDTGLRLVRKIAPDHFRRLATAVGMFSPADQESLRASIDLVERFGEYLLDGLDSPNEPGVRRAG